MGRVAVRPGACGSLGDWTAEGEDRSQMTADPTVAQGRTTAYSTGQVLDASALFRPRGSHGKCVRTGILIASCRVWTVEPCQGVSRVTPACASG